ncbi:DUF2252 family protein [Alkalicoccobacillus gibsonii]|uniref:DUF2252 family protein n=1 Tax=Alkalicoccobacillus gibsonii TaxID=79881 RepID=UPI003510DF9F
MKKAQLKLLIACTVLTSVAFMPTAFAEQETEAGGTEETVELLEAEAEVVSIEDEKLAELLLDQVAANGFEELTTEAMESITELEATGAGISNINGIGHATNLTTLNLSENQISDLTPLQELTKLEDLKLESNQVTNVSPLSSLTSLKKLNLRTNSVKDLNPLQPLEQLEKLDVRENGLSSIEVVAHFPKLKELNLRENAVSNLEPIRGLTELVELNLHTNHVQDLDPLRELVKLEVITMRRNQVSDISVLANLPLLKDLNLRDNQITSIEALQNHQFLTVRLNLRDNPGLTDFSPVASYYDQIEDVDFVISADNGKDLEDLDLKDGEERIAILTKRFIENNQYIQDSTVRNQKFSLLESSPFSFYRGSAHLFFEDAAEGGLIVPSSWTSASVDTWITGDFHIENIGFYGNGDRKAIFDFNDFDEVAVAPYYYDLLRFGTSLYLLNDVAPALQLDKETMNDTLHTFTTYYQDALEDIVNQRVDVQSFQFTADQLSGFVGNHAADLASLDPFSELGRWTQIVDGTRKLDPSNARLAEVTDEERAELTENWNTYIEGIDAAIVDEVSEDYFAIKDIARRTDAGLGSLGTERYYVLIEGETAGQQDDVILDVKSQLPSAVDRAGLGKTASYPNHADRTIDGMSGLHNNPDIHWGSLTTDKHSYLVKERSAFKDEFDQSSFSNVNDFDSYLFYSAKASAYAHTRAANKIGNTKFAQTAYALMNQDTFQQEFADLSFQYYGQTLKDHQNYRTLYNAGALSDGAFEPIEEPAPPPAGEEPPGEEPTPPPAGEEPPGEEPAPPPAGEEPPGKNPTTPPLVEVPKGEDPPKSNGGNSTVTPGQKGPNQANDGTKTPSKTEQPKPSALGGFLPKTATETILYLASGLTLLVIGVGLYLTQRRRKANVK